MTPAERQHHIDVLCRKYGITVAGRLLGQQEGYFTVEKITRDNKWVNKRIWIPANMTLQGYTIALHEVGHIARKVCCDTYYKHGRVVLNTLGVETKAWQYALQEAKEPLDSKLIAFSLGTYMRDATRKPSLRHPVWKLL